MQSCVELITRIDVQVQPVDSIVAGDLIVIVLRGSVFVYANFRQRNIEHFLESKHLIAASSMPDTVGVLLCYSPGPMLAPSIRRFRVVSVQLKLFPEEQDQVFVGHFERTVCERCCTPLYSS